VQIAKKTTRSMQDRGYEKQNKHTGMEVGLRERGPGSWSRPWVKPWVEPVQWPI
jgi:hypothetical protein